MAKMFRLEKGGPAGLPLIFLHAFPMHHAMWEGQLKTLPRGVRALACDVRGLGNTPLGDGQYVLETWVEDLKELL
ncbi:MAG: alpha/beta fold hydrolase, partial [Candidatus Binatia bacterium]